jgi:hypothetical protein
MKTDEELLTIENPTLTGAAAVAEVDVLWDDSAF